MSKEIVVNQGHASSEKQAGMTIKLEELVSAIAFSKAEEDRKGRKTLSQQNTDVIIRKLGKKKDKSGQKEIQR